MNLKIFAERLHQELDNIDFPTRAEERIEAFSKLIKIPRFKAETLLNGATAPNGQLLKQIAAELEVNENWLMGENSPRQ